MLLTVGKGPLAGPVTTCACWLQSDWTGDTIKEERWFEGIRDSKLFPKTKSGLQERKQIADFLELRSQDRNHPPIIFSRTSISVDRINELKNISAAVAEGWIADIRQVVDKLTKRFSRKKEDESRSVNINILVIIDGNWIPNELLHNSHFRIKSMIRGDQYVKAISAASILAKEWRDQYMKELAVCYPQYGFDKHAGYGTEFHTQQIIKYGLSDVHRKHFAIPNLESFRKPKTKQKQKSKSTTKNSSTDSLPVVSTHKRKVQEFMKKEKSSSNVLIDDQHHQTTTIITGHRKQEDDDRNDDNRNDNRNDDKYNDDRNDDRNGDKHNDDRNDDVRNVDRNDDNCNDDNRNDDNDDDDLPLHKRPKLRFSPARLSRKVKIEFH